MTLSIYQVFEDAPPKVLAALEEDIVYIGRSPPPGGITIDSKAVSREHAVFIKISNLWFYKDLGSSNGSWLNGQHVSAGIPYLLRVNDTIQMAESVVKLIGNDSSEQDYPAVAVFARGDFLGLYAIPEVGKVVSIGGTQADLKLDVDFGELPVVVVEKRANFVCAFPVARGNKAMINDNQLSQLVQLHDRDRISVSPYVLVVSIPSAGQLDAIGSTNIVKNEELRETFSGWEEDQKPVARTSFGQFASRNSQDLDHQDFDESERTIVSDMRPGGRFGAEPVPHRDIANVIEERIVFILGALMIVAILSLVSWWLLR